MPAMGSMVLWIASIAVSVSLLVVSAATGSNDPQMALVHMSIAALVALVFALISIRDTRELIVARSSSVRILAMATRHMGFIWCWGALALAVTYGTGILQWSAWWQFFLLYFTAAGLCLFTSATLKNDDQKQIEDPKLIRFGHVLATFQLFGMVAVIAALGFMSAGAWGWGGTGQQSWAALQIMMFGALGLSAICAYTLKSSTGTYS